MEKSTLSKDLIFSVFIILIVAQTISWAIELIMYIAHGTSQKPKIFLQLIYLGKYHDQYTKFVLAVELYQRYN